MSSLMARTYGRPRVSRVAPAIQKAQAPPRVSRVAPAIQKAQAPPRVSRVAPAIQKAQAPPRVSRVAPAIQKAQAQLSHVDARGRVRMVDVSRKPATRRVAVARGRVFMHRDTLAMLRDGRTPKGDVLAAAHLAGVLAAKR